MSKRFWMSWKEPARDHRPLNYPPNKQILGWWCSGYDSDDVAQLCAWVESEDKATAEAAVVVDWPGKKDWRFNDEVGRDWRPGSRFPLPEWSKERVKP